jgi:glucose dehydrogenase
MLAGAIFGEILRRFHLITYAAGALLLATLILRRILGPAPRRFAWRAGLATLMLAASVYSGVVVAGDIAALQAEIGAAPSSLPDGDARRVRFGRLHGLSTALQLVPLLGGLMLIYWEIRE